MMTWIPPRLAVVLGSGSKPGLELNLREIEARGIPVFRRPTGGCSVVLTPNMIVVSFALYGRRQMRSGSYFRIFNGLVMRALNNLGVHNLRQEGTSDIVINDKKIAGSALYRNSETVFYHAVVNVAEEPSTIGRILAMPPRMPDYREGRLHTEFVTSLKESGWTITIGSLTGPIEEEWGKAGERLTVSPLEAAALP
jgi:lipoate-protein ligase A